MWASENSNPAVLHAYNATTLIELYNSNWAAVFESPRETRQIRRVRRNCVSEDFARVRAPYAG